ncbi:hypothetical protein CMI37_38510 [Candidatus Pacearchaeota archaeon]|nr:hypothetical protein [Candidatus Pacearchaeota archaeon]
MNALIEQMSAQIGVLNREHYALSAKIIEGGIALHGETAIDPAEQQHINDIVRRMRGYIKIRDEELERIGILRDTEK